MDKYNSPLETNSQHSNYKTSSIKSSIFNLTTEEIPKHCELLLNLGPNVVPTSKNLPFMDIITSTKSFPLDTEHNHQVNEAETLAQSVTID